MLHIVSGICEPAFFEEITHNKGMIRKNELSREKEEEKEKVWKSNTFNSNLEFVVIIVVREKREQKLVLILIPYQILQREVFCL